MGWLNKMIYFAVDKVLIFYNNSSDRLYDKANNSDLELA